MSIKSSRACGVQTRSTGKGLVLRGACQSLSGFSARSVKIRRRGCAAGLALIPKLTQASQVFLAQLSFELPVPDCFADDLAGGGILASFDGGLEGDNLLPDQ